MQISAIGGQSSVTQGVQGSQDYESQIKALQKQKEQLQQKVNELNQDESVSSDLKQQQIQTYEAQIQALEARIEMLQQKQAEAAKGTVRQGAAAATSSEEVAEAKAVEAAEATAEGIDIKV